MPGRWVYLSPHLDDAVLSCGGLIHDQVDQGLRVEIWTIFAGDPPSGPLSEFASQNHALWGVSSGEEVVSMRKSEDRIAVKLVGAEMVHFDFPDCIYRRSPEGKAIYTETVISAPAEADEGLPEAILAALMEKLRGDDTLVCPLALGGHVDHILVRQAAESLKGPLVFYADVPYILNTPEVFELAVSSLEGQFHPISEAGLETWLAGIKAYRSQVDSLYKGSGTLFDAIHSYWSGENGIRLWQASQAM